MKKIFKLLPTIFLTGIGSMPLITSVTSCSFNNPTVKTMHVVDETGATELDTKILYKHDSTIPYISLDESFKLIKTLHAKYAKDDVFSYTISKKGYQYVVKRENGATLTIDPYFSTLTFDDFVLFICEGTAKPSCLIRDYGKFEDYTSTNVKYIAYGSMDNRIKYQNNTIFNLGDYDISFYEKDNQLYIPFQTMSDIFLHDIGRPLSVLKNIIVCPNDVSMSPGTVPTYPQHFLDNKISITQELLNFNYHETCFYFDTFYGLKNNKGITSFDTIFTANGWKEKMLTSVEKYEEALIEIIGKLFDDLHSITRSRSVNSSATTEFKHVFGPSILKTISYRTKYSTKRSQYEDIKANTYLVPTDHSDTAVITFDRFSNKDIDYYTQGLPDNPDDAQDSIGLFLSSYKKISNDSNIKNVVVDITCNGGGDAKACLIIAGLLAGSEINSTFKYGADDSINTCSYRVDANLDGKITTEDEILKDKNVYILTSEYSFSCGTFLPTILSQQQNCEMVGKRSGGGSCVVGMSSSALGTGYSISGPMKLGYLKNGVYFCNEEGIPPAYFIDDDIYYTNGRKDLITCIKSHRI